MSATALDEAAAFAQEHGGVSGCIIRHGYLVKEWGPTTTLVDIKSATKGAFGATALGLAVEEGLVKVDSRPNGCSTPGTSPTFAGRN
jgi:CubicO group peptidase (beta-lactamase class C family)